MLVNTAWVLEIDRLHVVKAWDQHQREEQRRGDGRPPVRAKRLIGAGADGENASSLVERELAINDLVTRLRCRAEGFRTASPST